MSQNENFAKIVRPWQIENLVGKVMLVVESFGLNENQLEAGKSLIKQFIWSEFNDGVYISPEMIQNNQDSLEKEGLSNITQ